MTNPTPQPGITALITTWCGYAYMLLGAAAGANYLWDLGIGYKGYVLPADWKIGLLGLLGGVLVAAWGHTQNTLRYQALSARHRWLSWLVWTLVVLIGLMSIFVAVL